MSATRCKRGTKPGASTATTLVYTTYEFLNRLLARGRPVRTDARDALLQWLHTLPDAIPEDWAAAANALDTLPPLVTGIVSLPQLCNVLSPLAAYDLQYVNLAVALHTLTPNEAKNLYRYLYLEWVQCDATEPWAVTPRVFGKYHGAVLADAWVAFLRQMVPPEKNTRVTLFFLNRLYAYLTPCG